MITLNPAESFPIVRFLKDHTDPTQYYVQAVIRDATTDKVIDTLNLDSLGNRRFSKIWKVAYDNAFSRGRFITITTSVYIDPGYSTLADTYLAEEDTYLIETRWNIATMSGDGRGGNVLPGAPSEKIDYEKIKKFINDAVAGLELNELETLEIPPAINHVVDMSEPVKEICNKIDAIKPAEKTDLSPILKKMEALQGEIEAIKIEDSKEMKEKKAEMEKMHSGMIEMCDKMMKIMIEADRILPLEDPRKDKKKEYIARLKLKYNL